MMHDNLCKFDETMYRQVGPMGPDEYIGLPCTCAIIDNIRKHERRQVIERLYKAFPEFGLFDSIRGKIFRTVWDE